MFLRNITKLLGKTRLYISNDRIKYRKYFIYESSLFLTEPKSVNIRVLRGPTRSLDRFFNLIKCFFDSRL